MPIPDPLAQLLRAIGQSNHSEMVIHLPSTRPQHFSMVSQFAAKVAHATAVAAEKVGASGISTSAVPCLRTCAWQMVCPRNHTTSLQHGMGQRRRLYLSCSNVSTICCSAPAVLHNNEGGSKIGTDTSFLGWQLTPSVLRTTCHLPATTRLPPPQHCPTSAQHHPQPPPAQHTATAASCPTAAGAAAAARPQQPLHPSSADLAV